jgi:type II secretory pathway pseudopilin PulG
MRMPKGHTLAELLVIVLIVGVLASVAIPRFSLGTGGRREAEMEARKIITDLRRTRSLAILHAATHPKGFALEIRHQGTSTQCEILDLDDSTVIDSRRVAKGVRCTGATRFSFGGLGALTGSGPASLEVSASGTTFELAVVPSTGSVRCVEEETP